ncbi:Wzz/FepE/Etk N-terminal domain-containing protein [Pseudoalteromonas luteoviolacea]|uniref:Polysaccharide chain length determinant N-terminal domain-containing protein n=1 Tax=Pseudoalteromonas luteoviolacea S4054 TaxID=1129367 RepID=A0A0F6ACX0_9GAMM|nr:Wzz/FepE/Etk N-terminal domain-containing protein [Pseudoalteromonas luteoviolacea]KKE83993.1 hypothetical protein N479_11310 [Pseudoalteromonas luteoviolacea S4054]KZN77387.1 hypothetical protein N481_04850 [Pseudoalteromonas luteoviolacea S4047-1]
MTKTTENIVQVEEDIIDLREIFYAIWRGKLIVISTTIVFAIASVIYALNQPNIYRSAALLSPVVDSPGGGINSLANQFGGLASIAGISLGNSGGVDKVSLAIQIMQSRQFVSSFVDKYKIKPELMAVEGWDLHSNTLIYAEEVYDPKSGKWLREVESPMMPEPSNQEAYKEFLKVFSVEKSKETGLVSVSVHHYSPHIAKKWVDALIFEINENMRNRELIEANKSINFLREQLQDTDVSQMKTVLYKLLEEQTKQVMFTNVRDEFAFKTIDPALVMEKKAKPNRALICILGTFVGAMLGVFFIIFRFLFK